jgi:hypothetical protein
MHGIYISIYLSPLSLTLGLRALKYLRLVYIKYKHAYYLGYYLILKLIPNSIFRRLAISNFIYTLYIYIPKTTTYSLYELRLLPPPGAQRYTSNFAKPAAKLVCRASRKRCSVWPWLGPPEPPRIWSSNLKLFVTCLPYQNRDICSRLWCIKASFSP